MPSGKQTSRNKRDSLTPHYCEILFCGYTKFFQRHRIIPGREGGRYKLGNVIALCPNHHAEADNELIPREELQAIVRSRIQRDESYSESRERTEIEVSARCWCGAAEESEPCDGVCATDAADGVAGEFGV